MRRCLIALALCLAGMTASCEDTNNNPAGVVEGTVPSVDGVPVHYRAAGSGTPALVFVHGWSCDGSYWAAQISHFEKTHRVVTVDLAGHGKSGLGRDRWTMAAFGADVRAVVDALDLRGVILVGHSMGGAVIVEAALGMPERVRGLVGVDNFQTLSMQLTPEQIEGFVAHLQSDFPTNVEAWVRTMFPPGADTLLVGKIARDMASAPPSVGLGALRETLTWYSSEEPAALARLAVPLECINSDRVPTDGVALSSVVNRYAVRLMPGRGHFLMLEDPVTFNRLLEKAIEDLAS